MHPRITYVNPTQWAVRNGDDLYTFSSLLRALNKCSELGYTFDDIESRNCRLSRSGEHVSAVVYEEGGVSPWLGAPLVLIFEPPHLRNRVVPYCTISHPGYITPVAPVVAHLQKFELTDLTTLCEMVAMEHVRMDRPTIPMPL